VAFAYAWPLVQVANLTDSLRR